MARAIRFSKPERELISMLLEVADSLSKVHYKAKASVLAKLEVAEAPVTKEATGLGVAAAEKAFRGVLAERLVLPPRPPQSWYAIQARAIKQMGVTEDDCTKIALVAAVKWQGRIKFESLVRQGAALLADGESLGNGGTGAASTLAEKLEWEMEEL